MQRPCGRRKDSDFEEEKERVVQLEFRGLRKHDVEKTKRGRQGNVSFLNGGNGSHPGSGMIKLAF